MIPLCPQLKTSKDLPEIPLSLLGFFVALFSAGIGICGGTIFVSAFISVFKFDFKRAAATYLAAIFPITFAGAISHLFILANPPSGKPVVFYGLAITAPAKSLNLITFCEYGH